MKAMKLLAAVAVVGLLAAPATADFFTAVSGPPGGEPSMAATFNGMYAGSTFTPTGVGLSVYTDTSIGGTMVATRVYDYATSGDLTSKGIDLDLLSGSPVSGTTDQIWTDGIASARGRVRYAGFGQHFGWDAGTNAASFTSLLSVGSNGYYSGAFTSIGTITGDFLWARADTAGGSNLQWSDVSANTGDNLDHMITYELTGAPGQGSTKIWLLFFDDQPGGGDRDFNDFVVEINAIPAPGAALLGVLGLGLVARLRRRMS